MAHTCTGYMSINSYAPIGTHILMYFLQYTYKPQYYMTHTTIFLKASGIGVPGVAKHICSPLCFKYIPMMHMAGNCTVVHMWPGRAKHCDAVCSVATPIIWDRCFAKHSHLAVDNSSEPLLALTTAVQLCTHIHTSTAHLVLSSESAVGVNAQL